jgi:hypothetical protein
MKEKCVNWFWQEAYFTDITLILFMKLYSGFVYSFF